MSQFQLFLDLNNKVNSIPAANIGEELDKINFLTFNIEEIDQVSDCEWIPSKHKNSILQKWIQNQNLVINRGRSNLFFQNTLKPEEVYHLLDSCFCPSKFVPTITEKIFEQISTLKPNQDLASYGFSFLSEVENPQHPPAHGFAYGKDVYFQSNPKVNTFAHISLPAFISINPTKYRIESNTKYGVKSWLVQGSVDGNVWIDIHSVNDNSALSETPSQAIFNVNRTDLFFSHFRVIQKGPNHAGSSHLCFTGFDLYGSVLLKSDQRFL